MLFFIGFILLTNNNIIRADNSQWSFTSITNDSTTEPCKPMKLPELPEPIIIDLPKPAGTLEVSVADFGAVADGPDGIAKNVDGNVEAFNKAIEYCRQHKASKLTVPKGVYRITSPKSIVIKEMEDFIFDGQDSTLIFSKIGDLKSFDFGFTITDCNRVAIRNINIDWDWNIQPLACIVRIIEASGDKKCFDVKFEYTEPVSPEKFLCFGFSPLDEQTLTPGSGTQFFYFGLEKVEKLLSDVLRVRTKKPIDLKKGKLYLVRNYFTDKPCFVMESNSHLTLDDIQIYSFPGMGFIVLGDQHHWQMLNCKITHHPARWRPVSITADGLHFFQSKGYLRMENCDFGYMADDCVNIHDDNIVGLEVTGTHSINAVNVTKWYMINVGDIIEFRKADLSPIGFSSKITSLKFGNEKGCLITFADSLPKNLSADSIMFNRRFNSANIIIRNCYFHETAARGLLLHANHVLVENCRFYHIQQAAVQIETGFIPGWWAEGYGAGDITFRNNTFEKNNPMCTHNGVQIYISVYLPSGRTPYPIFHDIMFDSNKFIDFPGLAMFLSSCKNIIVKDNIFSNFTELPYADEARSVIRAEYASELKIVNNKWKQCPFVKKTGIEYNPGTVHDVTIKDNTVTVDTCR